MVVGIDVDIVSHAASASSNRPWTGARLSTQGRVRPGRKQSDRGQIVPKVLGPFLWTPLKGQRMEISRQSFGVWVFLGAFNLNPELLERALNYGPLFSRFVFTFSKVRVDRQVLPKSR